MKFSFSSVSLETLAYHLPSEILTSATLEERLQPIYERLKLPPGRLELMTGIKERRIWPRGMRSSDLSIAAGMKALEQTNIDKNDIGILIHASVCRDFLEPATASRVHHHLGLLPQTLFTDLSNACLGVMNAWMIVAQLIEAKVIKAGMVVGGENSGPLLEDTIHLLNHSNSETITRKTIKKYIANLTIGSGAFASILVHHDLLKNYKNKSSSPPLQFLGGSSLTQTDTHELCQGDGNSHSLTMETDSEKLLVAGVSLAKATWKQTKNFLAWDNQTPQHFITHQVGKAHFELLYQELGIDSGKDYSTYPYLGNMGSVSLPITLNRAKEEGRFIKDDHIALLGIGSGLSSMMIGLKCL